MSLYPRYLIHWLTHCCCSNIYLVNISSYYMDNHDFIELGWIWLQWIEAHCCSVTNLCPTLCDSMDGSTPGFLVLHCLLEYAQTHVHWVSDVIQPSHPLLPPSPLAFNFFHHQSLYLFINYIHVAVLLVKSQCIIKFIVNDNWNYLNNWRSNLKIILAGLLRDLIILFCF